MQGPCLNIWDHGGHCPPPICIVCTGRLRMCCTLQGVIDGVSAYDMISRRAMMDGLRRVDGGLATLPFVRMFYGTPSEYLWEDSDGVVHSIPQGEGGEQGEMPLLFSVGQHHVLEVVNRSLTKVWNASGVRPPVCDVLEQIAKTVNPAARVWRGSGIPTEQQGIKILGTPLGHPDFVRRHLAPPCERRARGVALVGALCICKSQFLLEVSEAQKQWQSMLVSTMQVCGSV